MIIRMLAGVIMFTLCCTSTFAEETQKWTVMIKDGTTVIRATSMVEAKYIQGTISALQKTGLARFTLRAGVDGQKQPAKNLQWFGVQIKNGEAEIQAAKAVPGVYIINLVEQLSDAGIRKVRFAAPAES
ncbi:MAG: hypothetical protein KDA77_08460 [Planctomycetaceae bacterium]|nr:hypothetical protein [Planctomycetaceae bacterium]